MDSETERRLRILHLEDDRDYCDLVRAILAQEKLQCEFVPAATQLEFETALAGEKFDLILADYLLPGYNGIQALHLAREKCPQIPFLLVSGTIGEQVAIESLKAGATDYVLKQWPDRLVPAIRRAVLEAAEREQRRRAETELFRREKYFRALTENALDIVTILNREGGYLYNSPSLKRMLGYEPKDLAGQSAFALVHPEDLPAVLQWFERALKSPERLVRLEFRFRHLDSSWRYLEAVGQNLLDDTEIAGVVVHSRDITDRKEAEESLRRSEEQYRLIFDGNPTPMWVFDPETLRFLEVNDAAVRYYGYSREEFANLALSVLWPAEDAAKANGGVGTRPEAALRGQPGGAQAWRHRRRDGSLIDVELAWSPISFRGHAASLAMVNDVTERKRMEHRDAVFSKLSQSLSSSTTPAEAASLIRLAAEELFRWDAFTLDLYSEEEDLVYPTLNVDTDLEGRRFDIRVSGKGRKPSGMARRIVQEGAELILREEPLQMPEDVVPIGDVARPSASLMLVPMRNRAKVIGILSIQSYQLKAYEPQDLNILQTLADQCGAALERIRAEQALHQSELLFHSVWENSVDGMRLTDEQGTIVAVNEAFCKLAGMSRSQLEGKPLSVIYAASERPEIILQKYRQRFSERVIEKQLERRLALSNGSVVVLEGTNSFVELPGQPPLLLGLLRDVTAQKRLEDQLRQSQKMEAIGQLAGGVAHDFNNILTVIHGHASLLVSGGSLTALGARSATQIAQAAERAAGLTRQLLTFSRRQVMQPRRLDMNEVVNHMTQLLGRLLGEDISLQLTYSPQPALVRADASMMEQILLNLAVNSRDAMPKGGQLAIRISVVEVDSRYPSQESDAQTGRFVCLSAIDNGCGIAPENLRRIFEPFFTTKEVGKGTGLGLATVYGIVKQHQGWIEVESELGRGTKFNVFLPCSPDTGEAPEEPPAEKDVRGGTETILVVEDEGPVRELVCSLLTGHGYRVLQAESGLRALDVWKASKDQIDLVLTDLVMPEHLNGRELAERLWAERPQLKVIFTSGYSADVVGKDFVLRRGLHYLQKPYHPQKLALTVRDCLDAVN